MADTGSGEGRAPGGLLTAIFGRLRAHYGTQSWWPSRSGSRWEIMLGAVLTQRTTWTNVELSLNNMVEAWGAESLSEPGVAIDMPYGAMAAVLRPTGFHTSKPRTLKNLAGYVVSKGGVEAFVSSREDTEKIRQELLALWGIGPETADAILLYALGRSTFIADAYAQRLAARWGLAAPTAGYAELRALFMDSLPHDARLFNEYHALIVEHGKQICRPRALCEKCPLNRPLPVASGGRTWEWTCPKINAQTTAPGRGRSVTAARIAE